MAGSRWVVEVTADNFQEQVVEASRERPVVVDFWAPWCGPCRALGPVLERLAAESDGAVLLAKVNTDTSPDIAQAFQVDGIPAVFPVGGGKLREPSHADADLAAARAAVKADPESAEARYRLGQALAARGEYLPALEELIAAAERDKKLAASAVRELMVDVFNVIGPQSPEANEYRGRLRDVLY